MVEEAPYALMERTWKIMRKSVSTFLSHFEYFTTTPTLLMLPFSACVLVSQTLLGSSQTSLLGLTFSSTNSNLFMVNETYFTSQTFFIVVLLSFYLTSLLISKACVIQSLKEENQKNQRPITLFSCLSLYHKHLLITQLYNVAFTISTNMASSFLILTAYNSIEALFGLKFFFKTMIETILGLVFYTAVTNVVVLCNLSTVVVGLESLSAHEAMHKAYTLRRGSSNSTPMLLALPTNLGLASLEALFYSRLVRGNYYNHNNIVWMALEGTLIAYIYSVITVIDTISCCVFLKSHESDSSMDNNQNNHLFDQVELV